MENARMATKMRIAVDNTEPNASLTPTLDLSEAAMASERLICEKKKKFPHSALLYFVLLNNPSIINVESQEKGLQGEK